MKRLSQTYKSDLKTKFAYCPKCKENFVDDLRTLGNHLCPNDCGWCVERCLKAPYQTSAEGEPTKITAGELVKTKAKFKKEFTYKPSNVLTLTFFIAWITSIIACIIIAYFKG